MFDILLLAGAGLMGWMGLKPLKKSSEFRFQKKAELAEGLFFLGTAGLTILLWSWWVLLLGAPVAYLLKKKSGDTKLID